MAIDPATAILEMVKEISATVRMLFNGSNRKLLSEVKDLKDRLNALNLAERIFYLGDRLITGSDDTDCNLTGKELKNIAKERAKLRRKFNELD